MSTERETGKEFGGEQGFNESESLGLYGSIRRVLETTLATLACRMELFAYELKEAKFRLLAIIGWTAALYFLGTMCLLTVMGIILFLLWDHALAVLIGFSVFFSVVAVASFCIARNHLNKMPFEETVAQIKKDQEMATKDL